MHKSDSSHLGELCFVFFFTLSFPFPFWKTENPNKQAKKINHTPQKKHKKIPIKSQTLNNSLLFILLWVKLHSSGKVQFYFRLGVFFFTIFLAQKSCFEFLLFISHSLLFCWGFFSVCAFQFLFYWFFCLPVFNMGKILH